jgi:hypothetical protein
MNESHRIPANRPSLSPDTLASLGTVARRYLVHEASPDELQTALASASREARQCGLRAEELIVTCKSVWGNLPRDTPTRDRAERNRELERMVSICIEEYYADRAPE